MKSCIFSRLQQMMHKVVCCNKLRSLWYEFSTTLFILVKPVTPLCALSVQQYALQAHLAFVMPYQPALLSWPFNATHFSANCLPCCLTCCLLHFMSGKYEGPYDVLKWALKALGDEAGAAAAEHEQQQALAARNAPGAR
jgi:hypothetical protein